MCPRVCWTTSSRCGSSSERAPDAGFAAAPPDDRPLAPSPTARRRAICPPRRAAARRPGRIRTTARRMPHPPRWAPHGPRGEVAMARHARTLQALVVLVLGATPVARAEPASLSVTEENDVFCHCGLDRHYTQGLRLTLETSRTPRRTRWTLGQTIYTPGDLSRRDRIVGDR